MPRKVPRWKIRKMQFERQAKAEAARQRATLRAQEAQQEQDEQEAAAAEHEESFPTDHQEWTAADFHRYMATASYREHEDEKALSSLSGQKMLVDLARSIYIKSVEPTLRQRTAGNAVRISESQLPRIWHIHKTSAARLGIEPPDLYIESNPDLNAFSAGLDTPVVVLTSSLVDAFSQPELSFVIGHEIGHIACKHLLYSCTAYELALTLKRVYRYRAASGTLKALSAWSTRKEISADRAGLLCCGDLEVAIDCMVKLAIGSRSLAERVNVEEYLKQNTQFSSDRTVGTHPATVRRAEALRKWFDTKKCRYLLELADYCERT